MKIIKVFNTLIDPSGCVFKIENDIHNRNTKNFVAYTCSHERVPLITFRACRLDDENITVKCS